MKFYYLIFLFPFIFSQISLAQTLQPFTLSVLNQNQEINPGSLYHCVLKISNSSSQSEKLKLNLQIPSSWQSLDSPDSITIPAKTDKIQIISILSDPKATTNFYPIKFIVQQGDVKDSIQTKIKILPFYQLQLKLTNFEENLFADKTHHYSYELQNQSNLPVEALITTTQNGKSTRQTTNIPAHQSHRDTLTIKSSASLTEARHKDFTIKASVVDQPQTQQIIHKKFTIIPTDVPPADPYYRIPIKVSTLIASTNKRGERIYAPLVDLSGRGQRQNKKESIAFQFRGPDRNDKKFYSIQSKYYFRYKNKQNDLTLGTATYHASYLLENLRYGIGASFKRQLNQFDWSGFINYPKYYPQIKKEYFLSSSYHFNEKWATTISYFSKESNRSQITQLGSWEGKGQLLELADFDWEYAFDLKQPQSKAVKSHLKLQLSPIRVTANLIHADKDFSGYIKNSDSYNLILNGKINRKINATLSYSKLEQNMALDTLYSNAPLRQQWNANFNWIFSKKFRLTASFNNRTSKDQLQHLFDYQTRTGQLLLSNTIHRINLNFQTQIGNTKNYLISQGSQSAFSMQNNLYFSYRGNDDFYLSAHINYSQDNRYSQSVAKTWQYSLSMNKKLTDRLNINIQATSSYDLEYYYMQRNLLSCNLNAKIGDNSQLGFQTRYNLIKNSTDKKELSLILRYTHQFKMPIAKNKETGVLEGAIHYSEKENKEGVLIHIGSQYTITNKQGVFSFPHLKAGQHYLTIDYSVLGIHALAETKGPYLVSVTPGVTNHFSLNISPDCTIHGVVKIKQEKASSPNTIISPVDKKGITLSITNGKENLQTTTDQFGHFQFKHLAPGRWTIQINKDKLPNGLIKEGQSRELDIQPAEDKQIDFILKKQLRIIKFQQTFNEPDIPNISFSEKSDDGQAYFKQ